MKKLIFRRCNFVLLAILLLFTTAACEKFVQIAPPTHELITPIVFKNNATAEAAIRGVYAKMTNSAYSFASGFSTSITALTGKYADEIFYNAPYSEMLEILNNTILPANSMVLSNWNAIYSIIYDTNSILEGLNNSSNISTNLKKQLEGEAKFIRAFCYFYLVNLWGDVPLATTTDYRINSAISRTTASAIYEQIVQDLNEAKLSLLDDYSASNGERIRSNKAVVSALLARIYLYQQNWANAEIEASLIINNTGLYTLENNLNNVFLKNSMETIWQLFPTNTTFDTYEGQLFIPDDFLISLGLHPTLTLSNELVTAFEENDNRQLSWTGSIMVDEAVYIYPYKYKIRLRPANAPISEYSMVFRLAEQHLIRAEARAQQGKIMGANSAESDINTIRLRAGLPSVEVSTQQAMLLAIEQERRVELFSEWGHRWFDLVRTGRAAEVLSLIKPDWTAEDMLWPIPQNEMDRNPLLTQNSGY